MAIPAPFLKWRQFDANGDPLTGGKLYTYIAGTTTPLATYTDAGGGTANANPVVLDANGEADVYLGPSSYKLVLKNSADVTQWTKDNVQGSSFQSVANITALGQLVVTSLPAGAVVVMADYSTVGGQGGGVFVWRNTNMSAKVAQDTRFGIWVAPASDLTGASGAWERQFDQANLNAAWFGAVGDAVTDNSPALQAAIDVAEYLITLNQSISTTVVIPPGKYNISTTLTMNGCSMVGASASPRTQIQWVGTAGGTMIDENNASGYHGMHNLWFVAYGPSGGKAAIILDLTSAIPDIGYVLTGCTFQVPSDVSIKMGQWVNIFWEHLRFDGGANYCIQIDIPGAQDPRPFHLSRFTYDNQGEGKGFMLVNDASNGGSIIELSDARLEFSSSWTGNASIIDHVVTAQAQTYLHLRNLVFGGTVAGHFLITRTGAGDIWALIERVPGASAQWGVFGGTPTLTVPTDCKYRRIDTRGQTFNTGPQDLAYKTAYRHRQNDLDFPGPIIDAAGINDTNNRFELFLGGDMEFGPGNAAQDVGLRRSAAKTLQLNNAAAGTDTAVAFVPEVTGMDLGASGTRWDLFGDQIVAGAPTGGQKGSGTINIAGDIYKNDTAYTNPDYVLELAFKGAIERFVSNPGASRYRMRTLEQVEAHARRYLRLPGIGGKPKGAFERSDVVLEKLEELFLHMFSMNREIKALKKQLKAHGRKR